MSTALVPSGQDSTVTLWQGDRLDIIKNKIAPGIPDDELALFAMICKRTELDPFFKQIYAIKRGGRWTIQTGIDGYRLLAARTGVYAGSDEPEYDSETATYPTWAKVTVWKLVQGQRCPFTAKARWDEYAALGENGKPQNKWADMPYLMLAKCAEALALRKAFPAELSGLYTDEEMDQAENPPRVSESSRDYRKKLDTSKYKPVVDAAPTQPTLAELQKAVVEACKQNGIDKAALEDFIARHQLDRKNPQDCRELLAIITAADTDAEHCDLWITQWAISHGLNFGYVTSHMAQRDCKGLIEQRAALADSSLEWLTILMPVPAAS